MTEEQETDLWWGSYSGWTMWPSFLICLLLTAMIGWLAWRFVERDLLQFSFLSIGTGVWLFQFTRWGLRVFGFNYRLTTRRLLLDRGYRRQHRFHMDLKSIAHVQVRRSAIEKMVDVGRIVVQQADPKHPPLVLEGVARPFAIADVIREAVRKVQESEKST